MDLFDRSGVDQRGRSPQEIAPPPGLRLIEEWIDEQTETELLRSIDASSWRDDLQRRVQHYGWRYDYKARKVDESMRLGPLPTWAASLIARISAQGLCPDRDPDQVIVNEYVPGQGISAHVDCIPCFGPVVFSLSLGSTCAMDLTGPNEADAFSCVLHRRSMLILAGEARSRWAHAIPGRKSDVIESSRVPRSRRVSLTFRTVLVA